MAQTNSAAVQASAKRMNQDTDLPDGPNVGPSPYEHLAAQGDTRAARPVPTAAGSGANPLQGAARKSDEKAASGLAPSGSRGKPQADTGD